MEQKCANCGNGKWRDGVTPITDTCTKCHYIDKDGRPQPCNWTQKEQTNADLVRAMSDEELAEAFFNLCEKLNDGTLNDLSDLYCDGKNGCVDKAGNITCTPEMEKACVLRLLQQPAAEVSKWTLRK